VRLNEGGGSLRVRGGKGGRGEKGEGGRGLK